ncbi:EEF1A lysine methyltransferase 3-like [Scyliorhinus canicula]|uniref:EEF1A lysine methyltransferase 3-like n=1 Tax=Scyliorhinus canicula TaxID=7830 RepID=UPI0018F2E07C|nr:EEF1A lysine methyltransferase 3-like [Scyliorhinus canicula]
MPETNVVKLMERDYFLKVYADRDFLMFEYYNSCGFQLKIGVNPFSRLGFGAMVWEAALGLCQYFEKEEIRFSDKKVIELGAGTGILSILVALLGGDVTITDKSELLKLIKRNVSYNIPSSLKPQVHVSALHWGHNHTLFPLDYDYILCSDIMYFHYNIPLILKTLLHLCSKKTIIYFASTMSYSQNVTRLGYVTLSQYFQTELVCRYDVKDVNVYRMIPNTPPTVQLDNL